MSTISTWSGKEDPSGAQAYFDSIAEAAMSGQTLAAPVTASVTTSVSGPTASNPSSGLADSYRSNVTAQLAPLKQAATALSIAQVSTTTDMFCELIEEQALLFALQSKYSKPADLKILATKKQKFFDAASLVKQKDLKAPPNHIGIIIDSMNLFGSALLPADDSAKEFLKEIYESLPFLGNKILMMEKPLDTAWVTQFLLVCKAHYEFIAKNFAAVHTWSGTEAAGFEQAFLAGAVPVTEAPKAVATVQATPTAPVKKAAPAKRASSRAFKNKTWTFENYNGENITLQGSEEVDKSFVLNFFACQNLEIRVIGKIKSVALEGCKKVVLIVDTVVADVNVMNCSAVKIFGNDQMKSVTAESTNELMVNLNHKNKDCKVITTCTRSVWIRWPKDGADDQDNDNVNWHRQPVAEIYESKIINSAIETKPTEMLE
jgi:hypothetical protein